jgi:nicotinamidase-related amidase
MATTSATSGMFDTSDATAPGYYMPSQTALLLLDFHQMFVEKAAGPKGPAALQTAADLRTWAKSHGIQVIHCLIDVHGTPYPTCKGAARVGGIVTAMAKDGGDEPKELTKDSDDDERTYKRRPGHVSALESPGLEEYLQSQGVKSLILAGLSTSGCVLRTALAACDAEYVVTVFSDGCADGGEGLHDLALKIVESRGYVTTAVEFRDSYGKAKDNNA